jgi:N-acetylglutamate synthase-like GNAT family acetyltransferase
VRVRYDAVMILLELVRTETPGFIDRVNALLAQVSQEGALTNTALFAQVAADTHYELWVAKDEGIIVGMASLIGVHTLSGVKGEIDNVVVDEVCRGKGVGKMLIQKVIDRAREQKYSGLFMTSKPSRVAANALYQKMGFQQKETNVYRMKF